MCLLRVLLTFSFFFTSTQAQSQGGQVDLFELIENIVFMNIASRVFFKSECFAVAGSGSCLTDRDSDDDVDEEWLRTSRSLVQNVAFLE